MPNEPKSESELEYLDDPEPQPAPPMTEEELAALPPQEDGPAPLAVGVPDAAPEGPVPPAIEGLPPESTGTLSEQEGRDGSRSLVHLFQEIPGHTEVMQQLLYGTIQFQHGPIQEVGINGGTIEGVVQVLKERLEGFQRGEFACEENSTAIVLLQRVLNVLALRTRRRQEQGVEGTNAPHEEA